VAKSPEEVEERIFSLIDLFSKEYGWTQEYVLSRTLFQIRHLRVAVSKRQAKERENFLRDSLVANHPSNAEQVEEYIDALHGEWADEEEADDVFGAIPDGISVKR
jgi:hypothetical protein